MRRNIFTPWGLVFLSALFLGLGLGIRLFRYGDATALIGFGCLSKELCLAWENRALLPHPAFVFPSGGYDGQFYYYLAADLGGGGHAFLDDARLRKSRIAFPAFLSIFFRFGDAKLLLWAIFLSPILLHLFSVYKTLVFFKKKDVLTENAKTVFAKLALLCLALNPFVLLSASLGLADTYASSLAFLALLLLMEPFWDKHLFHSPNACKLLSSFLLAFAFLSKETSIALYPVFLSLLWENRPRQDSFKNHSPEIAGNKRTKEAKYVFLWERSWHTVLALLPPAALLAWWMQIGFVPWETAGGHAGRPFFGILWFFHNSDVFFSGRTCLLLLTGVLLALVPLLLRHIRQPRSSYGMGLVGLLLSNLVLVVLSTEEYWMNFSNIARLFVPVSYLPALALFGESIERGKRNPPLSIKSIKHKQAEKVLFACLAAILLLLDVVLIRDALFGKMLDFEVWP